MREKINTGSNKYTTQSSRCVNTDPYSVGWGWVGNSALASTMTRKRLDQEKGKWKLGQANKFFIVPFAEGFEKKDK